MALPELSIVPEPLITFGQLLKIKREALRLGMGEAKRKSGVTMLHEYENGKRYPKDKMMLKLVTFYRLTQIDFDRCKDYAEDKQNMRLTQAPMAKAETKNPMVTILEMLHDVTRRIEKIDDAGFLAKKLKLDALDCICAAQLELEKAVILDRLI